MQYHINNIDRCHIRKYHSCEMNKFVEPTKVIDCDNRLVITRAEALTEGKRFIKEKAIILYYFVRDEISFNPLAPGLQLEDHKASVILERGNGYCQHKAILLVALARAVGIPARLGFVDIKDHLMPRKLRQIIGGDNTLVYHGYVEFYLDGKWVRASPTFDLKTCKKNRFIPVDFDGITDAKDSPYNEAGEPHIEYILDRGPYDDFPWQELCIIREELASRLGSSLNELEDRWWGKKQTGS